MTYQETVLIPENLENLTEEQMSAFAVQFNQIEPGGAEIIKASYINTDFIQMLDFMDVISISGVAVAVIYLAAPYVRKLPQKLAFIRS